MIRQGRASVLATCLTCLLLIALPSLGTAPEGRIWLVRTDESADTQPVRLELESLGFVVVDVSVFDPKQPLPEGVVAVVDLAGGGRQAQLWVVDGEDRRALHRGTVLAPEGERTMPVRVAEDLRALMEHRYEPPATPRCPEPTCPAPTCPALVCPPSPCGPVLPPKPRVGWKAGLDAAILLPSDGVGVGGLAFLELQRGFGDRFHAGLLLAWPLVAAHVEANGSSSTVNATMLGARGHVRLLPDAEAKWNAGATVGLALQWLRMDGQADPPRTGRHDEVWSSLSFVGIEALYSFSEESALRAGLSLGTSVPPVRIRFVGQPTAEWGAPLTWLSLGFETGLF